MTAAEKRARPRAIGCVVTLFENGEREPTHCHADHGQLKWPTNGLSRVRTPLGLYVVPPTHAAWIPAGHEHGGDYVESVRECSLYVHKDYCAELPDGCALVRLTERVRHVIEATVARSNEYDDSDSMARDSETLELLARELRDTGAQALDLPITACRVQIVLDTLRSTPDDGTTADQWARRLGMSARTFQRAFSHEACMPFAVFRKRARLMHALERLALGIEVAQVAAALGYRSDSAFIHMFRRSLGTTPSQYFG